MTKLDIRSVGVKADTTDVLLLSFEPALGLSGVTTYVRGLSLRLAAAGVRVLAVGVAPSPSSSITIRAHGLLRIASLRYATPRDAILGLDALRSGRIAAVHSHEDRLIDVAAEVSRRSSAALFHTVHYVHPDTGRLLRRYRPTVVAVSQSILGELHRTAPGLDAHLLRNFADARWAKKTHLDARGRALRHASNIPPDAPLILFAGRANAREKGADVLLRAADILLARYPNLVIVFVGTFWLPPGAQNLADRMKPSLRVVGMVGHGSLNAWYRAANVVAVPSRYEPFGLAALEAQTAGTPVVATNVGGLREVVHPGFGRLVPTDGQEVDPSVLAEGLALVLHRGMTPADRKSLSSWAIGEFPADAHVQALVRLYGLSIGEEGVSRIAGERSRESSTRAYLRRTSGDVRELDIERAMEIARRHAAVFAPMEDRERLASEATSRAWEARARYNARRGTLEQWMFGIVRNVSREWLRDRARTQGLHRRLLGLPEHAQGHTSEDIDALADLRSSFARLDERQQLVLYLRYWCDLPYRDVSARTGMTEAAARQAVRRALIELGRKLR